MVEVTFSPPPLGSPAQCRVFLPSRPRHFDFTDLSRFGAICITLLRDEAIYPDQADAWEAHNALVNTLANELRNRKFDPYRDYFVLVGDPLIQMSTMLVIANLPGLDEVTVLRYDGQSKSYWPFRLARPER